MRLVDPLRYACDAATAFGADVRVLDDNGYLIRISVNDRSIVLGAGPVSPFFINNATAVSIARDKGFSSTTFTDRGLPAIPGEVFFAHSRRAALRAPGREAADALAHAARLGFPVFAKPCTGARGNYAEVVRDAAALEDYIGRLAVDFEAFLIQPVVQGVEHRVLIHDGRSIFHAVKQPAALTGDGVSTLSALLDRLNAGFPGSGLSPWPASVIADEPQRILAAGERFSLPGRRNLSAEGDIASFSTEVPPVLHALARDAVAAVGLRFGAVDIFDVSPRSDLGDLLIIEVNGNPGLRTLELAGRSDIIREIWTDMLRESLGT
ncbi:MAG: hypothetical protein GC155_10585 [Alphaproteobacteria bacterium]|nr:hypothetical protein [Alphaproteobacteria bacterium]